MRVNPTNVGYMDPFIQGVTSFLYFNIQSQHKMVFKDFSIDMINSLTICSISRENDS